VLWRQARLANPEIDVVLLYFVGVFASYLLVLKREGKKFPWVKVLLLTLLALLAIVTLVVKRMLEWRYRDDLAQAPVT